MVFGAGEVTVGPAQEETAQEEEEEDEEEWEEEEALDEACLGLRACLPACPRACVVAWAEKGAATRPSITNSPRGKAPPGVRPSQTVSVARRRQASIHHEQPAWHIGHFKCAKCITGFQF